MITVYVLCTVCILCYDYSICTVYCLHIMLWLQYMYCLLSVYYAMITVYYTFIARNCPRSVFSPAAALIYFSLSSQFCVGFVPGQLVQVCCFILLSWSNYVVADKTCVGNKSLSGNKGCFIKNLSFWNS